MPKNSEEYKPRLSVEEQQEIMDWVKRDPLRLKNVNSFSPESDCLFGTTTFKPIWSPKDIERHIERLPDILASHFIDKAPVRILMSTEYTKNGLKHLHWLLQYETPKMIGMSRKTSLIESAELRSMGYQNIKHVYDLEYIKCYLLKDSLKNGVSYFLKEEKIWETRDIYEMDINRFRVLKRKVAEGYEIGKVELKEYQRWLNIEKMNKFLIE